MALTGQAKTDYQREYMRRYRSNTKAGSNVEPVRPKATQTITREQAQEAYDNLPDFDTSLPKAQSFNPMMAGYVSLEAD